MRCQLYANLQSFPSSDSWSNGNILSHLIVDNQDVFSEINEVNNWESLGLDFWPTESR